VDLSSSELEQEFARGKGAAVKGPGSFRVMRRGNGGNLGNIGNVESVTCRSLYPGDGTNPPLSVPNSLKIEN
jgi:hypothetical protein